MKWTGGGGLLQGGENQKLRPGESAARAEAAAILILFSESVH